MQTLTKNNFSGVDVIQLTVSNGENEAMEITKDKRKRDGEEAVKPSSSKPNPQPSKPGSSKNSGGKQTGTSAGGKTSPELQTKVFDVVSRCLVECVRNWEYSRLQKIKKWIRDTGPLDVIMLHEMRVKEGIAERRLMEITLLLKKQQKRGVVGRIGEDPRRNWDMKWTEMRRLLMQKAAQERRVRQQEKELIEELNREKIKVANNRASVPDLKFEEIEEKIKTLEKKQEDTWRRWSRVRWIKEGEMPSKFFFSLFKAKRVKESITSLKTEDG
ncbi:hypothetical protein R1sor_000488 [Riccia sorocarpa]|uniref:Uncharacterized protein n=1 Tax=Riccia sorocarpa TaxID=122646 RepID=A0ABD3GXE5_9MARC